MTITMRDRYRGAMVGTECGDSLLAAYEWMWTPEQIAVDMEARGGLVPHEYEPFDYVEPFKGRRTIKKGQPTDDSELSAALALSLIEKKSLDEEDVYNRLRAFIVDRKSILTERAYGSGRTLRAALDAPTYRESVARFEAGIIPTPPSNGSLMRCVAVPLAFGNQEYPNGGRNSEILTSVAIWQSMVTHRNSSALWACVAYSHMVKYVLLGNAPANAWSKTRVEMAGWFEKPEAELKEIVDIDLSKPDYERDMKGSEPGNNKFGWVVLSLRAALWASIEATDFADGIIKVGRLGGDTDTYGAIAGGILGAHFGIQGIPEHWLNVLQGRDIMIDLADKLYNIAHS